MSYEEEEKLEKLAKYRIIKGILIIAIIHRETKEFIYNFFHPMSRVSKEQLKEAEEINDELELFYGDIKLYKLSDESEVIFYEGSKLRLMTILKDGTLTEASSEIIERILEKFLYEIEAKYQSVLKEWTGDTSAFQGLDEMLYDYLNVDLTFPHISKYRGFEPEDPLEQYVYTAAEDFTRRIGYFYLDNLIYLTKEHVRDLAREKGEDPEKVQFPPEEDFYLAIFKLKKLGMLEKIDNFLEDLNIYSKINY
ncbi:MAG: hypothetical protein EU548_01990 [Promethearchaeota archaeon]|nr:MAG: hypothetical protein EU548_01990 [Candidatus Lokiarchaeota archaeon]